MVSIRDKCTLLSFKTNKQTKKEGKKKNKQASVFLVLLPHSIKSATSACLLPNKTA